MTRAPGDILDSTTPDESAAGRAGVQPVKSAARALDILEDLAQHGATSLHVLAKRLRLPKSSLHALLRTMEGRGWVETDVTGTVYGLGVHSLLVGAAYVDGDLVVGRTAPLLDELAAATGETVHLARLEGSHVIYTAKRESQHPLRMFSAVGRRLPAYSTALGRSILADLPDEQVRGLLPDAVEALTDHTITDHDQLMSTIAEARRNGYAVEREESCVGVSCFAISLPFTQPARHAISIAVPLPRLDDLTRKNIVELLITARRRLADEPFARPL